ncbi:MAG TPA: hypothetical protein VHT91_38400 [Kofleriaceae bacterium]|nr:hypothetical protein [Kofleriaceae bacterium]
MDNRPGERLVHTVVSHDGAAPSDPTRVQVAYDDDNLYIAIDCVQHTPRLARLTRRDRDRDRDVDDDGICACEYTRNAVVCAH